MTPKKDRMRVKLRIPLFLLTLGFSIPASKLMGVITQDLGVQQLSYPLLVILLIYLFEKTKLSNKVVHVAFAAVIVICGFGMEILAEPGDYWSLQTYIS